MINQNIISIASNVSSPTGKAASGTSVFPQSSSYRPATSICSENYKF